MLYYANYPLLTFLILGFLFFPGCIKFYHKSLIEFFILFDFMKMLQNLRQKRNFLIKNCRSRFLKHSKPCMNIVSHLPLTMFTQMPCVHHVSHLPFTMFKYMKTLYLDSVLNRPCI